jgi:hypothetical protein
MTTTQFQDSQTTLAATLREIARNVPQEGLTIRQLLELVGEQGLLMFCMILTVPFFLPVSIPGVSTVFGLLIILIGLGVMLNRLPWLPERLMNRHLDAANLIQALEKGAGFFARIDKVIRPRWPVLTDGATVNRINGLALIFAGVLLMAPFGLIPFSNTLPALACLFFAAGMLQRDGLFILLGYVFIVITVIYFGGLFVGALLAGRGIMSLIGSG